LLLVSGCAGDDNAFGNHRGIGGPGIGAPGADRSPSGADGSAENIDGAACHATPVPDAGCEANTPELASP
jgi:hypothetical protein